MNARVIGIDFSTTSTGIAIHDVFGWSTYTVRSKPTGDTLADYYERVRTLSAEILAIVQPMDGDVVGIEAPIVMGRRTGTEVRLHYAWHRFVEAYVRWGLAAPVEFVPASVKKLATGNGRAQKSEMVAAVRDRLGFEVRKHDEADAVWIAVAAGQAAGVPIQVVPLPEPVAGTKGNRK